MSKKVNGKKTTSKITSPAVYIKEKARTLPIVLCRILTDSSTPHIIKIVVARRRPRGKLIGSVFTIDKYCLGIKEALTLAAATEAEIEALTDCDPTSTVSDLPYPSAHSLIYGGVDFARKGGIEPHTGFSLAKMVIDAEEAYPINSEEEFGLNGIPTLIRNTDPLADLHIRTLKHHLGDNFRVAESVETAIKSQPQEFLKQPYSYRHPRYPATCKVRHSLISNILRRKNHYSALSLRDVNAILSLPADQASDDIARVILYEIGRTYKAIAGSDDPPEVSGTLIHALMLLTRIDSPKALRAISEITRQSPDFIEYHLGDLGPAMIPAALYMAGRNDLSALTELVSQSGISTDMRAAVASVFELIVRLQPKRRKEVIKCLRTLLRSLPERLPRLDGCDAEFAGVIVELLCNIKAKELFPEIRNVFATGCIIQNLCGTLPEVEKAINDKNHNSERKGCLTPDEAFSLYLTELPSL